VIARVSDERVVAPKCLPLANITGVLVGRGGPVLGARCMPVLRRRGFHEVEIADAEAVVSELFVQHGAEALSRRAAACIGRPAITFWDGRGGGELSGGHGLEPFVEFCRLLGAHHSHLVQAGGGSEIKSLPLAVRNVIDRETYWREQIGRAENAPAEPRVVDEDQVTQGLQSRPLAVYGAVLHPRRCPQTVDRRRPVRLKLPPPFEHVSRDVGADQQSDRIAAIEFSVDVGRDLDTIHHEIRDETINLGILHDNPDEPRAVERALTELGSREVLLDEALQRDRLRSGAIRHVPTPDTCGGTA
jgi:hypothetical protein